MKYKGLLKTRQEDRSPLPQLTVILLKVSSPLSNSFSRHIDLSRGKTTWIELVLVFSCYRNIKYE